MGACRIRSARPTLWHFYPALDAVQENEAGTNTYSPAGPAAAAMLPGAVSMVEVDGEPALGLRAGHHKAIDHAANNAAGHQCIVHKER